MSRPLDENRDLQYQQHQTQAAEPVGLAEGFKARCGLLAGTEVLGTRLSRRPDQGGWLFGQFGAEKRPGTASRSWRDANPF
jgi:hypothetical protein